MVHCEYKPLLEIYQTVLNETMQIRDIAQVLNLATPNQDLIPTEEEIVSLLQNLVNTIFDCMKPSRNDDSTAAEYSIVNYEQIQTDLQRQESLNRLLIKKQLEFKEYHKCIMDELQQQRKNSMKLLDELQKYNRQNTPKHHMPNLISEKKFLIKQMPTKDYQTMDTLIAEKKLQGIKIIPKNPSLINIVKHRRGLSDIVSGKRPSSVILKKKVSNTKR